MGGDSCSKGRGFESRLLMLDGHFFTYLPICCKICNVCLKRRKQIKKRPHWPIFKTIWGFESMRSKYVESCDFNFVELFEPRPCETSNLIRFLDLYHRLEMCFSNFLNPGVTKSRIPFETNLNFRNVLKIWRFCQFELFGVDYIFI